MKALLVATAMLSSQSAAQADPACPPEHAAMGHCTPASAAAPEAPAGRAADRVHPPEEMAKARARLHAEHGGGTFGQLLIDRAEYRLEDGRDQFHWDAEAWWGGDLHRLVLTSEGEGTFGGEVEHAEMQALYAHTLDPYWDLQAGIRHDIRPNPSRTYAVLGVEGLAPYWFEVEAALFLSEKGDVLGRIEASYDQRITQRLILQPRAELNLAAQDVTDLGIGAGLSDAELGLRLRYEIRREFAPYVGLSYERKFGETGRLARGAGEDKDATALVAGIRLWF